MRSARPMSTARVNAIARTIGRIGTADPEHAHGMEARLRTDVLAAIASGRAVRPAGLARAALRTSRYRFPRWFA